MRKLDDIYREVLWRTQKTTNDIPYPYASGGAYGFLQLFADEYQKLVQEVVLTDSDHFLTSSTDNLVANQQEYYLPNDLIRLRYIELGLDGTSFYTAQETDPAFFVVSERNTVSTASVNMPKFWLTGSINTPSARFTVAPNPTQAVTNGIKIYYDRMPSALFSDHISAAVSAASAVVHFPQQFDYLIPLGIAVEVWGKYGVRDQKAAELQRYEQGLEKLRKGLRVNPSISQRRMRDFRETTGRDSWRRYRITGG